MWFSVKMFLLLLLLLSKIDSMKLKVLKEKIRTLSIAKQQEFNELEVIISYPHIKEKQTIKRFVNIYRFAQKQFDGWSKLGEVPEYFKVSQTHFSDIYINLNKYINSDFGQSDNQNSDKYLNQSIVKLQKDNIVGRNYYNKYKIFTYDAPETMFLFDLHAIYPNSLEAAIKIFSKETFERENLSFDNFIGMYQAIEFRSQDIKRILRSEAETKSIQFLKHDFNAKIDNAEIKLDTIIDKYNSWLEETQKGFQDFDQQTKQTIKDNELLYGEKLKLEKPASYWEKRALKLEKEGRKWRNWLIGTSIIAVVLLFVVLLCISTETFKELFKDTGVAIRWSVVFVAFISFLAFGIRTFAKLMFSAYHLSRDAEEREQLAYVYLALINDKNIDEKERHLVLQSLFSRSDSGLLKSDTSPTMPGNILEKLSK